MSEKQINAKIDELTMRQKQNVDDAHEWNSLEDQIGDLYERLYRLWQGGR